MRINSGQPSLLSYISFKSCDQGSVRRLPIMIALTPSSSMSFYISRLKSFEYSWTSIPYLTRYEFQKTCLHFLNLFPEGMYLLKLVILDKVYELYPLEKVWHVVLACLLCFSLMHSKRCSQQMQGNRAIFTPVKTQRNLLRSVNAWLIFMISTYLYMTSIYL